MARAAKASRADPEQSFRFLTRRVLRLSLRLVQRHQTFRRTMLEPKANFSRSDRDSTVRLRSQVRLEMSLQRAVMPGPSRVGTSFRIEPFLRE